MTLAEGFFWVILTVYFEASGEPPAGQRAVVKVILNRAKAKGWPLEGIVFARKQFSCWNKGIDTPQTKIRKVSELAAVSVNCLKGYDEWLAGDTLMGATHYYAPKGMVDGKPPWWISSPKMKFIMVIDDHRFYREG